MRLQRYSLGAFTYLLAVVPLAAAYGFGFIAGPAALGVAGAAVALNAVFFYIFRRGLNLRFRDPSLTKAQIFLGVTLLMGTLYHVDAARGLSLGLCYVVFLFGVFRLTTREFLRLTLYTLAAYALIVNLLMHLRPQAISDVAQEWLNWLLLAVTLPWFGVVGGKISALRESLKARNSELREAVDTIRTMATRDDVTGLHNRPFFVESLRHALAQAERHQRAMALLLIDVDRFKQVNDSLGHAAGDRVLREMGARIAGCVRASDIVARLGGDEFIVLLEDIRSREAVQEVAEKIVTAAAQPCLIDARALSLSASIGIATAPEDGTDAQQLLRCADIAMYRAKHQGRNGYSFYARQMGAAADERLLLESELAGAAERGELRLHFQPKAAVADGRVSGVEALLRWQHPRHGLLAPARFIHVAEETGAIVPIGRWVLETACQRAAAWPARSRQGLRVAVNLSARQFADPGLVDDVEAALRRSGLEPTLLELEITESLVMLEPVKAAALMQALRRRGVRLSMDDFGTGYSSLGNLKRFPLDSVKIDRSFVYDLPNDADSAAIARAVLAMAHALGLQVVAEGVERPDQLEFLRREGCQEFQGYYCSPPVPEKELLALLGAGADASEESPL